MPLQEQRIERGREKEDEEEESEGRGEREEIKKRRRRRRNTKEHAWNPPAWHTFIAQHGIGFPIIGKLIV